MTLAPADPNLLFFTSKKLPKSSFREAVRKLCLLEASKKLPKSSFCKTERTLCLLEAIEIPQKNRFYKAGRKPSMLQAFHQGINFVLLANWNEIL